MLDWQTDWDFTFPGDGFAHGGLAVGPSGELIAADADGGTLLVLDGAGAIERRIDSGVTQAHGLSVTTLGGRPAILVSDPGFTLRIDGTQSVHAGPDTGGVVALDLRTGGRILELDPPPASHYRDRPYRPTFAISDVEIGGNGRIWVADGYGASLVHRYAADGTYELTLTGETGAGAFDGPHGVHLDSRGVEPRLYVADRNRRRVQVYDLDGQYERSFGIPELTSPSGFAQLDDAHLLIAELRARLVIVDESDTVRWVVGADDDAPDRPGWPNRFDAEGNIVPPDLVPPGRFNSPHAIVADLDGSVYVSEFVLGGRLSKLTWRPG